MSHSSIQKDPNLLSSDQQLHEIKRYLTHLQSYVFLAKVAIENNEPDKAKAILEKHEQAVQNLSKLCQSAFGKTQ